MNTIIDKSNPREEIDKSIHNLNDLLDQIQSTAKVIHNELLGTDYNIEKETCEKDVEIEKQGFFPILSEVFNNFYGKSQIVRDLLNGILNAIKEKQNNE